MDEQNVLVSEDVCEPVCPNLESSEIPAENSIKPEEGPSGLLLSAELIQPAHLLSVDSKQRSADKVLLSAAADIETAARISSENQRFAGNSVEQQQVVVSSFNRISDETCISGGQHADAGEAATLGDIRSQMQAEFASNLDVECTSSQHITRVHERAASQQRNTPPVNEYFKDTGEMPGNSEMKQDAVLCTNQQVNAFASAYCAIVPGSLNDAGDLGSDEQANVAQKGIPMHLDGPQRAGATDAHYPVEIMMDKGCQGEASLEMLSVAVESFVNMQRESQEGSGGAGRVVERTGAEKEISVHDNECNAVDANPHVTLASRGVLKSPVKKSMGETEDHGSFIFDSDNALGEEIQNKDHFLNLLCELAAVQQQEQDLTAKRSTQVTSCMASFVDSGASGEPRIPSFVDLLRKQMAQAGTFTEVSVDAFYEQFLRQNQAILGGTLGKDLKPSLPSAGISSNDGVVTALEDEQISDTNLDREGDTPSNEDIVGDFRNIEASDEVSGRSIGDDEREEIRGEEKELGVGDLVWAKVKSHPWWPGQIFNAADASVAAKRIQRPNRTLVAFFGDGTFGWLQQSQLIAFRPNFEEKVKQTTMKSFCRAVADALVEVSRRTELGLRCCHSSDAMYSKDVFPDLNAGMRKGVRIKSHQDIRVSRGRFEPKRVLEFVQTTARVPLYSLRSGLDYSELCGHVYGFRNFMLSPKKPKSKIPPENGLKVQNKLEAVQSSSLKRRLGLSETGDGSSVAEGKEAKRLRLSQDMMTQEQHAGNKVQASKLRTMENLLLSEVVEKKVLEAEIKSLEHAKRSTWLAKGKRLHISQDCKGAKRVKGWPSLGHLGDLADLGVADNLTSTDDDSKTLLDMTGYHSLKKKKKGGASKCITDTVSKKVEHQPIEAIKELLSIKSSAKLEKVGEGGDFPDSSTSSLNSVVPDHNLSAQLMTNEYGIIEEVDKDKGELPDLKVIDAKQLGKGNRELLDLEVRDGAEIEEDSDGIQDSKFGGGQEIEEEKGELQNLGNTDVVGHEKDKGELPDLKVGDAKETEENEGKLLEAKESASVLQDVCDHDNILKRKVKQTKRLHCQSQEAEKEKGELARLKVGDASESDKDKGKLEEELESSLQDVKGNDNILKVKKQQRVGSHSQEHEKDKGELADLKVGDAEKDERDEGKSESLLQDVDYRDKILKGKKKQTKRLHSQEGDILSLLVKSKKRTQDTSKEGEKQPSSSSKNEHLGSKKSVKSSKLGVSIQKVADTLKGVPANNVSAKRAVSATSIQSEAKKSPRSNQCPSLKNLAAENFNSSLAKLLNSLQTVARDPLSSANMKSSLHGMMSTFLKFRSMVFLKSSGYGAAGAGKLMSSHGNGHLLGNKKADDKCGSGKQTLPCERQKSNVTDSSEERKSIIKAEPPSESAGSGDQRHAVQDSSSELKVAAVKRPCPLSTAFGSHKSDAQKTSHDSETASGETPLCPKYTTGGSQNLGLQELAVAARKKKSEVLKECAAKVQVKNEVHKGQNLLIERLDKVKFTDARHHAKSVKHHISRPETLSLPERKSSMYDSVDVTVAQTSLGLFMQFPDDFTLPSEAQLKEIFNPFGILETAGIRVYRNASTAQVVFKHSTDAEAAWRHARKNRMFGHANVSYRLRHFSLSSKSNSKYFKIASAENSLSAEAFDLVQNHGRQHNSRSFLSSGAEQGGSIEAALSPTGSSFLSKVEPMDSRVSAHSPVRSTSLSRAEQVHSPVRSTSLSRAEPGGTIVPEPSPATILSHVRAEAMDLTVPAPVGNCSSSAEQGGSVLPAYTSVFQKQEAFESVATRVPLRSNLFSPPSVSNVNVPCGDIQDEMLKLLQQVSLIVSSSMLTPRTT